MSALPFCSAVCQQRLQAEGLKDSIGSSIGFHPTFVSRRKERQNKKKKKSIQPVIPSRNESNVPSKKSRPHQPFSPFHHRATGHLYRDGKLY